MHFDHKLKKEFMNNNINEKEQEDKKNLVIINDDKIYIKNGI